MKIVFVTPYIPSRIRVRSYQLIRSLIRRGHDLTLLAVWTSAEDRTDMEALQEMGVRVVAHRLPQWRSLANAAGALRSHLPLQAVYSVQPQLMRSLDAILAEQQPDVVHVEHLRGAQYGLYVRDTNRIKLAQGGYAVPVVWDSVDCISYLFQQAARQSRSVKGRMMTRLELPRTRRYEGWLVNQFDSVLVSSPVDKAALADLAMQDAWHRSDLDGNEVCHQLEEKLTVLPNGVDLDYFAPQGACPGSTRVVFSGKMSYHANVTAVLYLVQEIMPLVWRDHADAEVWIVGKDPAPEVRALSNERPPSHLSPHGRVVVTGTVPDIRPYLHQAAVAVAPLVYGAGIQNKILEGMSCGIPVVASKQAAAPLAGENGCEFLVAGNAPAFASAITSLLDDPKYGRELGQRGRLFVEQNHSWESISATLELVYEKAINTLRMKV